MTITEKIENYLNEGTWAIPNTVEKATKLVKIVKELRNDSHVFATKNEVTKAIYNLIGDDKLFDQLGNNRLKWNQMGDLIAKRVSDFVNDYEKKPKNFSAKFDPEALKILKSIK